MGTCSEYNVKIPKESPVYKLYEELKAEPYNVTDADFDNHGYHLQVYSEPGKEPILTGVGDCIVRQEEVKELALDDPKYRAPFEKMQGHWLLWAWGDKGSAFPSKAEGKEKKRDPLADFEKFIKFVKVELKKRGIQEGSDDYKTGMGEAVYYFFTASGKKDLAMWPTAQKMRLKKEIDGALAHFGIEGIGGYIIKNGGTGSRAAFPFEYNPAGVNVEFLPPNFNAALYGLFEYAGLSPEFVEAYNILDDDAYVCGTALARNFIIGLKLSTGYKLFDAQFNDPDVKKAYYYPVHKRQVADASNAMGQFMDWIIKSRDTDERTDMETLPEDMFLYVFSYMMNMTRELSEKKEIKEKKEAIATAICDPPAEMTSNPYLSLVFGLFCSTNLEREADSLAGLFQNPDPFISGEAYRAAAFAALAGERYEMAIDYASHLLERDKKCSAAYDIMARANYKMGQHDKAEEDFRMAEGLVAERDKHPDEFYAWWGKMRLEDGKLEEAVSHFYEYLQIKGIKGASDSNGFKIGFLLAVALGELGRAEEAGKISIEVLDTVKTYVGVDLERVEEISKWLDETIIEHKPQGGFPAAVYTFLGQIYLYHGKKDGAKLMADKASAIDGAYPPLLMLKRQIEALAD